MAVEDILDDNSTNLLGNDNKDCSLWVEKYKPRGYMDLLSEEVRRIHILDFDFDYNFTCFYFYTSLCSGICRLSITICCIGLSSGINWFLALTTWLNVRRPRRSLRP